MVTLSSLPGGSWASSVLFGIGTQRACCGVKKHASIERRMVKPFWCSHRGLPLKILVLPLKIISTENLSMNAIAIDANEFP